VAKQGGVIVQTFSDLSDEATITFANGAGTYILEVNAKEVSPFTGMRFNNAGDKLKITKNLQWGVFNDTRQKLFTGCSNLTQIGDDNDWLNSLVNGNFLFRDAGLTSLPSTLTLSLLEFAENMFDGCTFDNLPTNMRLDNLKLGRTMFRRSSITELPPNMTLPNLENGSFMFLGNSLIDLPTGITLPNLSNGDRMLEENTINTERYSKLLIDMEAGNNNTNVPFHGGGSKYNAAGETARNLLIANQNWTITDGGLV
jgi:hypothetical protein